MIPTRKVLLAVVGQSNQQGASCTDNGGGVALLTSAYTGETDPFELNGNGGGSCWPKLIDLGRDRGVVYKILNGAVGGASLTHFTGTAGASVVGDPALPKAGMNMSGVSLTGGTGVPCAEGDAGFDPFGLLAQIRTAVNKYPQFKDVVWLIANAESDGGIAAGNYQAAHVSIGNYAYASRSKYNLHGLSSSGANDVTNMTKLSGALTAAIAQQVALGKNAARGADLYAKWGMNPPLFQERFTVGTSVHLTLKGQETHAALWDAALQAAGY